MTAVQLWAVGAYETAVRGRVTHVRYVVIADSAEEAIAMVRAEHQSEALPETDGARYVAEAAGRITKTIGLRIMSAKGATACIEAGLP